MDPVVSVIVPTRNRPERLRHALASIVAQRMPTEAIEVVVVNDGGVDIEAQARDAIGSSGPAIRVMTVPFRKGLPAARNIGITQARGRYIAFLDDDDVFLPDHFRLTLDALEAHPIDGVYTTCLISTTLFVPPTTVTADEAFDYPYSPEFLSVCNYIQPNSLVLRNLRDLPARFDRALPALEDWDMWLRLVRDHGFELRHLPEATAVYHKLKDQASMTGSTATTASAHRQFAELHRILWRRWPAANQKAARYRDYVSLMDQMVLRNLIDGQPPPSLYYQYTVRLLSDAWNGSASEDDLIDRLLGMLSAPEEASIPYPRAHESINSKSSSEIS